MVRDRVAVAAEHDVDPAIFDFDVVSMDVVCEGVECAAGREIESGVMPKAGEESLFNLATMQREAHMRAAVVYRSWLAIAPEDADWLGTDLACQDTRLRELPESADRGALDLVSHLVTSTSARDEP
jgi:hypothetical protein